MFVQTKDGDLGQQLIANALRESTDSATRPEPQAPSPNAKDLNNWRLKRGEGKSEDGA